jgi:flagellar motor switch protein FliN/FliY
MKPTSRSTSSPRTRPWPPKRRWTDEVKSAADLAPVFDVPVNISAVLGKANLSVAQLLQAGPGQRPGAGPQGRRGHRYLREQPAGRPGEVVVVDERLGVTMTEIIKTKTRPPERRAWRKGEYLCGFWWSED